MNKRAKQALLSTISTLRAALPILFAVLLLVSLVSEALDGIYQELFTGNYLLDPLIGALAGSFSFGIPLTSYLIGGELLSQGISMVAVTAFIISWTTVGVVMLPLESSFLGRRFALWRNLVNFIFAIVISILTVVTIDLI
jgi:phosphoglycerol transferase MdoB-like AlkP superfamily enzyme